jgi:hypothetical protein
MAPDNFLSVVPISNIAVSGATPLSLNVAELCLGRQEIRQIGLTYHAL